MTMKFILLAIGGLAALEILAGAIFLLVAWVIVNKELREHREACEKFLSRPKPDFPPWPELPEFLIKKDAPPPPHLVPPPPFPESKKCRSMEM